MVQFLELLTEHGIIEANVDNGFANSSSFLR